jgi:hypothetical protein
MKRIIHPGHFPASFYLNRSSVMYYYDEETFERDTDNDNPGGLPTYEYLDEQERANPNSRSVETDEVVSSAHPVARAGLDAGRDGLRKGKYTDGLYWMSRGTEVAKSSGTLHGHNSRGAPAPSKPRMGTFGMYRNCSTHTILSYNDNGLLSSLKQTLRHPQSTFLIIIRVHRHSMTAPRFHHLYK